MADPVESTQLTILWSIGISPARCSGNNAEYAVGLACSCLAEGRTPALKH